MPASFLIGLADAPATPGALPAAPAAAPAPGAVGQPAAQPNMGPLGCGGGPSSLMLPIVLFALFYFMLIRPQSKKAKEQQEWIKQLKKGDEVVTTGGVIGKISGLTGDIVTLEVQEKVRMRVLRSAIAGKAPTAGGNGASTASSTDATK